jgi:hypothetical protein
MRGGEMKKFALLLAVCFGFLVGCEQPAAPVKKPDAKPGVEKKAETKKEETKKEDTKAPPAPEKK